MQLKLSYVSSALLFCPIFTWLFSNESIKVMLTSFGTSPESCISTVPTNGTKAYLSLNSSFTAFFLAHRGVAFAVLRRNSLVRCELILFYSMVLNHMVLIIVAWDVRPTIFTKECTIGRWEHLGGFISFPLKWANIVCLARGVDPLPVWFWHVSFDLDRATCTWHRSTTIHARILRNWWTLPFIVQSSDNMRSHVIA